MALADLQRYRYGGLAARVLEENPTLAVGALEGLASDFGVNRAYAEGAEAAFRASEEGLKAAVNTYATKYFEARNDCLIDELFNFYDSDFVRSYIGDVKTDKLKAEVNKFSGEKLTDINGKIKKAKYILDGKKNNVTYSATEIKDAEDTLEKYKKATIVMGVVEEVYFERLRATASENVSKHSLNKLADEI